MENTKDYPRRQSKEGEVKGRTMNLAERNMDKKHGIMGEHNRDKINLQMSELKATTAHILSNVHWNLLHGIVLDRMPLVMESSQRDSCIMDS